MDDITMAILEVCDTNIHDGALIIINNDRETY